MTIAPSEPLSQVVFLHDYFQLLFEQEILSVYNPASLAIGTEIVGQGQIGFCDGLVALIDQKAKSRVAHPNFMLEIEFASSVVLRVHVEGSTCCGPEAFSFSSRNGGLVVAQNGPES